MGRVLRLDQQGWLTLIASCLIALITLFTSYSHVDIPGLGTISLNQQVGVFFIAASLATLAGDAQLASYRRYRAEAETSRRHRAKARCTLAILEFINDPTPTARQRLRDVIALIREYPELA